LVWCVVFVVTVAIVARRRLVHECE
jgi:hypothetical protein